ncbi:pax-interacting protein 1 [Plakobranchus ocellatus]|uniref:PAX-interacting protein 1 n=1 Tax=Plakobranchus ocellatus TaxID=259542 RepID=A0AAV3ZJQ8_9GAST|nr:pax-interacting protein 1 [Plakobranchus ocellatus]
MVEGGQSESKENALFKGVTYYIVGDIGNEVIALLDQYGAKRDSYLSEMVSHVIADSPNSDYYSEAKELFELPIVTKDWVTLSVKCGKQLPYPSIKNIKLLRILETEDILPIWGMIVYHGGRCQLTLDKTVTHLITSSLEGSKFECAKAHADSIKTVTPDWVGDSVAKRYKQNEEIYHPDLVEYPKPKAPTPEPELEQEMEPEVDMEVAHTMPEGRARPGSAPYPYFEPMDTSVNPMQRQHILSPGRVTPKQFQPAFEERLELQRPDTPSAKEALARKISSRIQGKASSEPTTPERPSFPPPVLHRSLSPGSATLGHASANLRFSPSSLPGLGMGLQPRSAALDPSNIRNTLRNITNRSTAPTNMQLRPSIPTGNAKMNQMAGVGMPPRAPPPEYPFANRGNIPVSGPSAGASHPNAGPGPGANTVVTAGVGPGPAGPIPSATPAPSLVTSGQSPSGSVYFGHDPKENVHPELCLLGCVFCIVDYQNTLKNGEVSVWKKVIEQYGGQLEASYCHRVTHVLCANQKSEVFKMALKEGKRVVSAFWLNDCLMQKKMVPPWQALHLPLSFNSEKPGFNQRISVTNFDGEERMRLKQMIHAIGAKYTGYMTHHNSALICKKSGGMKFEKAKEWRIAVVNVQWLSDLVLGNMDALRLPVHVRYLQVGQGREFHMDLARVTHLMGGWKTPVRIHKDTWKKFAPTLLSLNGQENNRNHGPSPPKRQKVDVQSPCVETNNNKPKILFTLYPASVVSRLQNMVKQLGGIIVTNPRHCTHLVCPSLARTIKFFVAINTCRHIVTKDWLEDSFTQEAFIDETAYALKDPKGETALDVKLAESLKKAHTKPLFQGLTFYISPSVVPPVCELVSIIESAGGTIVKKRPPVKQMMASLDEQGLPKFIVITCLNDLHLIQDVCSRNIPVFNAEFVLTGVMRQEVDYNIFRIKAS